MNSNRTTVPFSFVPVHEQVRKQACSHPDQTAVIWSDQHVSYKELNDLSDRVASALIRRGVQADSLIALLFDREPMAYVAEFAILKSGAGFLPLIPEYPDERIRYCMHDSGSRLLLTSDPQIQMKRLQDPVYEVISIEELLLEDAALSRPCSFPQVSEHDLAYCVYTSGTTGKPKGVLIEHHNFANYVYRCELNIDVEHLSKPGTISLALAAFSFDFSILEAWVPLCHGNTIYLAAEEQIHDPVKFADMVFQSGVNTIACTPTYLLGLLAVSKSQEALKQIRLFLVGAEVFPTGLYSRLRRLREDSTVMNLYGPTECTVLCSSSIVSGEDNITVGKPRANVLYHVMNQDGEELHAGQKGELVICGSQVGRGYAGRGDMKGAFYSYQGIPAYHTGDLAAWTRDGEMMIYGRIDHQIKLHGYRIEPEEIEKVMTGYPGIRLAAVSLRREEGSAYLAGYYTCTDMISVQDLKRYLSSRLPKYMVPAVFMELSKMPVSSHGKIDRSALPHPKERRKERILVPPVTDREKKLCRAMERSLHLPAGSVGMTDDFFELSGDSISAMGLLAEADIPALTYTDLFVCRTPENILSEIDRRASSHPVTDLDQMEPEARLRPYRATPVQRELYHVQMMIPQGATVSSIRFLKRFDHSVDPVRFQKALNRALANHPCLAMRFSLDEENTLWQEYDPSLIPQVTLRQISSAEEQSLSGSMIRPFDRLLGRCLCRAELLEGPHGLYFFLDVHHLLIDALSIHPFLRDIADAYNGKELDKDPYLALLAMEETNNPAEKEESDRIWLLNRYSGYDWRINPILPDPSCLQRGGEYLDTPRFTVRHVRDAVDRLGVSLSVMHLASLLLAITHTTGEKDIMVFWTFHNRQMTDAENAVGMLIKTLPVGIHMGMIHSTEELLSSVKEQVISGVAHSAYGYLVDEVFSRGIKWVESNLQIDMDENDLDFLNPEDLPLQNAYPQTADNVVLSIITNSTKQQGMYQMFLTDVGEGISTARVEQLHREIIRILEAIVLEEDIFSFPSTDEAAVY